MNYHCAGKYIFNFICIYISIGHITSYETKAVTKVNIPCCVQPFLFLDLALWGSEEEYD
jgi:uncharacterized membrane protein YccF (DUF307 family)